MKRLAAVALGFGAAAGVFLVDWLTKAAFFLPGDQTRPIGPIPERLVELAGHKNYGLTFDIPFPILILVVITLLVIVFLLIELLWKKHAPEFTLAVGLILGGAVGNMIDRMSLGFVRDWLLFFSRSAVNVADMSIAGGVIWLLFSQYKRHPRSRVQPFANGHGAK